MAYGWTPQQVANFAAAARTAGAKYVGLEHSTGHIPLGNAVADYQPGGLMSGYDTILGEFNDGQFDDTVWQVLPRMGVNYRRPTEQPAADDPRPPNYLSGTDKVYRVFEFGIYGSVRGTSVATIQAWRAKFEALGAVNIC